MNEDLVISGFYVRSESDPINQYKLFFILFKPHFLMPIDPATSVSMKQNVTGGIKKLLLKDLGCLKRCILRLSPYLIWKTLTKVVLNSKLI